MNQDQRVLDIIESLMKTTELLEKRLTVTEETVTKILKIVKFLNDRK